MKNFQIDCIIFDKLNPSNEAEDVVEIHLSTLIADLDSETAIITLNSLYNVKNIISIEEIL